MVEKATACEGGKVCVRKWKSLIVREKLGMGEGSWEWERKAGNGRGDFGCVRERKRFVLAEAGMCRYNG